MLKRITTAIAQLLTSLTQPSGVLAQPMQPVGPAPQEPTQRVGNKRSAAGTKPRRQSKSPAQQPSPKKQKAAPSTKAASKDSSKKPKPVPTAKSRKAAGKCTPTVVSKTRQHVK